MPVLNASAINEQTSPDGTISEKEHDQIFCQNASAAALFTAKCAGETPNLSGGPVNGRTITITMHSGPAAHEDYGHFEDGDHDEDNIYQHTGEFFYADSFLDYTKPVSNRENYIFAGWSTNPEATTVNVEYGVGKATELGTDLYAVWTNKAYILYSIPYGVWENTDGEEYQHILVEYNVGQTFQDLPNQSTNLRPAYHYYTFNGWYTGLNSKDTHYIPGETIVGEAVETIIYAGWDYIPDSDALEGELVLGEQTSTHVSANAKPVFKFTPSENGFYEVYTDGIEWDGSEEWKPVVAVRIKNSHGEELATEKQIDPTESFGDKHAYYEMQAGETYYIEFFDNEGQYVTFEAGVRKSEMITVTLNANRTDNKAWFDGDHTKTTKEILVPSGDEISYSRPTALEMDTTFLQFSFWMLEPDAIEHTPIVITEPITIYAGFIELAAVTLDFNGGYHPYDQNVHSQIATFSRSNKFSTPMDPKIDNPEKSFAGWSRNRYAEMPDEDIIEDQTASYELDGVTLYAVYTDKIVVTFNTIGDAFMMDDPNATTFESVYGNGHIFYGMAIMHDNPRVNPEGWMDEDGVMTHAVSASDSNYHLNGDTTFTSVLSYLIPTHGNGGHFVIDCGLGNCDDKILHAPYTGSDSTFSYGAVKELIGLPVPYEENKYFLGYATSPDATEPNVIDGVTYLEDLFAIYAVWGDEYPAYLDDSSEVTYEKKSEDGLRLIVKRTDDDNKSFSMFAGLTMDYAYDTDTDRDIYLSEDVYDDEEGSLILTIHADYLDTLAAGNHTLSVHFNDIADLDVAFTIVESEVAPIPDPADVPDTGANSAAHDSSIIASSPIIIFSILATVCLLGYLLTKRQDVK